MIMIYYLLVFLFLMMDTNADTMMNNKDKLVIDNDAGGDDAMAIFLALLYETHYNGPNVVALTTVNGNTAESNVYYNNQRILKVANRQEVPIYRGCKGALVIPSNPGSHYGVDGLGDTGENITGLVPAQEKDAVTALIELSKTHERDLTVVAIGPVTNIALAISMDPGFLGRLKHLYVGAGHLFSNTYTIKEFNARTDPESYYIVARNASPDKVTVVPFSQVIDSLSFTKKWRTDVLGTIDTEIMKSQNKFEQVAMKKSDRWHKLDPAVVAIALRPDLVKEFRFANHSIYLEDDKRGINTNEFVKKEDANVRFIYSAKDDEYKLFLLDVFSKQ